MKLQSLGYKCYWEHILTFLKEVVKMHECRMEAGSHKLTKIHVKSNGVEKTIKEVFVNNKKR